MAELQRHQEGSTRRNILDQPVSTETLGATEAPILTLTRILPLTLAEPIHISNQK